MQNITNYETKEIECDKCGRVSKVAKHIPLRFAKCPECGSLRIRLHKTHLKPAPIEDFVRDLKNYIESDDE